MPVAETPTKYAYPKTSFDWTMQAIEMKHVAISIDSVDDVIK